MNTRNAIILLLVLGAAAFGFYYLNQPKEQASNAEISTKAKKGEFKIHVSATGELKAKRSEKIRGPRTMRSAGIWQTSVTDLIPEGTIVKEGDYVASLDKTEIDNKMKDAMAQVEQVQTQLDRTKIDTAIEMRGLRDQLINLKFNKKEKELQVEQSKYEPQMVIQQAKIDLQRTDRDYNQLLNKYELKKEEAVAKVSEIHSQLKQEQNKINKLQDLAQEFSIKAPKSGMVIYSRRWNGEKKGPGSEISSWDPVVAELPDLSDMISKTYVNEVDISRVKKGQDVNIKIDAFPDQSYTGTVLKVANIGEQLRGFDSKVFEVSIQVNEPDSILRPAMTTGVEILTEIFEEVLSVPLEALHSDSVAFVYTNTNAVLEKREVIPGLTNDNAVIIEHGLTPNDAVQLTIPENGKDLPLVLLDKSIKDEIRRKQEEEEKARKARMLERQKAVKDEAITSEGGLPSGVRVIFN